MVVPIYNYIYAAALQRGGRGPPNKCLQHLYSLKLVVLTSR
jgi:hypothetical protein